MRIINIEESVFEKMMERLNSFVLKVDAICSKSRYKSMAKWLDNQDLCEIFRYLVAELCEQFRSVFKYNS